MKKTIKTLILLVAVFSLTVVLCAAVRIPESTNGTCYCGNFYGFVCNGEHNYYYTDSHRYGFLLQEVCNVACYRSTGQEQCLHCGTIHYQSGEHDYIQIHLNCGAGETPCFATAYNPDN